MPYPRGKRTAQFPERRFGSNAFPPGTNAKLNRIKKEQGFGEGFGEGFADEAEFLRAIVDFYVSGHPEA